MSVTIRFTGQVSSLSVEDRRALLDRVEESLEEATPDVPTPGGTTRNRVSSIISRVRLHGDGTLYELARDLDGVTLASLEVPWEDCLDALNALPGGLRRAMQRSADNIQRVHEAFKPHAQETESEPGIVIGRRPDPLQRVGVYAPGGRAAYPSSVLMGVIPARVAAVDEIIVCSPPTRETGRPSDVVMAAAALAGAHRVFALGGAGAIAAMAYGTASVPRTDRIVGPGNAYVAEAKIQVSNVVAIDSPAGPSELLVVADDSASVEIIAREMLAQAEHDPLAAVVAVTTSAAIASGVCAAIARLLPQQPRADIIRAALEGQGAVLWTESLDDAIAFSNAYAAEHLLLLVESPDDVLVRLRNAGTIFVGQYASVAFGDYMTGANHVLPTGGLARSYSGLSTLDFVRWTTYQRVTCDAAGRLANDVGIFADAEGLGGHAIAARAWLKEGAAT